MTASSLPPPYVQYHIRSGFLRVTGTSGDDFNAFSAQPVLVRRFAGVVLMHDWWGLEASTRLLADQLAEAGFVVIAPDLFDGKTANTPAEAQALMQHMDERHAYARLTDALDVLRKTHNTARRYAVVGVGLGGGFAFKVAAQGLNVHAVAAAPGFPQRWIGRLGGGGVPVLGVFGEDDPLIPAHTVSALKAELGVHGEVVTLPHLGHDLWPDNPTAPQIQSGVLALRHIVRFLHTHLAERRP